MEMSKTRKEQFKELFPDAPRFRTGQMLAGLFSRANSWDEVTTFSKEMRDRLKTIPWITVEENVIQESKRKDTVKALLKLDDGALIETVLMQNKRGYWTICVSSQVGCAMRCGFCATGKMGLTRNLASDEIVDQYRFWAAYLAKHPKMEQRISNIVFMGMGEPLANYDAVKEAVLLLIGHTDIGPTRITISTVGLIPVLKRLLEDREWPHTRLAISLHSADAKKRKEIVPTSFDDFLPRLKEFGKAYLKKYGNRRHHLTFEYVMLRDVNDSAEDAKKLAAFVSSIGSVKVNLIPCNFTDGAFEKSPAQKIEHFQKILEERGVVVTARKTMGDDIAAACGQLKTVIKHIT